MGLLENIKELKNTKRFITESMNLYGFRFSIPDKALEEIPDEMCYIRKRQ